MAIDTTATELTPALLDLMEHEKVIEAGLHTFMDVGLALFAIKRDAKFKAAGYSSWEQYLNDRWDMNRHYGNRLIVAANIAVGLGASNEQVPMGTTPDPIPGAEHLGDAPILPVNERQVRPLALLPEAERADAWREAVEASGGEQPSAQTVSTIVAMRRGDPCADGQHGPAAAGDARCACGDIDLRGARDPHTGAAGVTDSLPSPAAAAQASPAGTPDATGAGPAVNGGGAAHASAPAPATPRPKSPAPSQKEHPAPFSKAILDKIAELLNEHGAHLATILDPFAGTGRVHDLRTLVDDEPVTVGIELEPEWAALHPDTICDDARNLRRHVDTVDAIVTSPSYGNRMADTFTDGTVRQTYTACLGHDLSDGNSGAMQWGGEYRSLHAFVWDQAVRALRSGGLFVLNCKNHVRDGAVQRVTEWHVQRLVVEEGLDLVAWEIVPTRGLMAGEHHDQRVDFESVVLLRKAVSS